jgi:hypothetical protein
MLVVLAGAAVVVHLLFVGPKVRIWFDEEH